MKIIDIETAIDELLEQNEKFRQKWEKRGLVARLARLAVETSKLQAVRGDFTLLGNSDYADVAALIRGHITYSDEAWEKVASGEVRLKHCE